MAEFIRGERLKGQSDFERLLREYFPVVAAGIEDVEQGLLHLEMAALARATCGAIEAGDLHQVQAHLRFIDELFGKAGPDLENAVCVSYLENIFVGAEDRRFMWAANCYLDAFKLPSLN